VPESTAQRVFDDWLRADIAPLMKSAGWTKSANTFRRQTDEAVGVIQLTKSHWSRADHLWFWIKAGIWSVRLDDVDQRIGRRGSLIDSKRPGPDDCHWRMLQSSIMRPADDWELFAVASKIELDFLTNVVGQRLQSLVIPAVTTYLSDAALRDELLRSNLPLGPLRLAYLYTLLDALGPRDRLPAVGVELRAADATIAATIGLD
jgi:hypothetical protein